MLVFSIVLLVVKVHKGVAPNPAPSHWTLSFNANNTEQRTCDDMLQFVSNQWLYKQSSYMPTLHSQFCISRYAVDQSGMDQ